MLLLAKYLGKILAILNSEVSPAQIAAGFAYGALLGLLPVSGLLPLVGLLLAFIVNINLAIMFLATAVFKLLAFLLDPLSNWLGFFVLVKATALHGFWTRLYSMPLVPYTKFNNTIVMGSLVLGLLLLVPLYFAGRWGVVAYRTRWRDRLLRLKVVQVMKASTLYRYYESYRSWRGE